MAEEVYEGAIGIDLGESIRGQLMNCLLTASIGTTYSCVANYEGTNVEISESSTAHILISTNLTNESHN